MVGVQQLRRINDGPDGLQASLDKLRLVEESLVTSTSENERGLQ
jgi:hypothetical protein